MYQRDVKRYPSEIWEGGIRIDRPLPPAFQLCERCERQGNAHAGPQMVPTPTDTTAAELRAWQDYLARWRIDFPVVARFEAYIDDREGQILRIRVRYHGEPDARDPSKTIDHPGTGYLAPSRLPDDETPRWLRQQLRYHLDHELDEHLRCGDVRPFNPHHDSGYICESCLAKMPPAEAVLG